MQIEVRMTLDEAQAIINLLGEIPAKHSAQALLSFLQQANEAKQRAETIAAEPEPPVDAG